MKKPFYILHENNLRDSKYGLNESDAALVLVGAQTMTVPTLQPVQVPAEKPSFAMPLLVGFIALIPLFLLLWVFRKK